MKRTTGILITFVDPYIQAYTQIELDKLEKKCLEVFKGGVERVLNIVVELLKIFLDQSNNRKVGKDEVLYKKIDVLKDGCAE